MDLEYIKSWVKKEYKIDLTAYKEVQLHRRLNNFISRVGAKNERDFIDILSRDKELKQKFKDFITINVTEFFRNPEIFKEFEKIIKTEVGSKNNELKIWSAACSIGAEPYSVAMLLNEINPRLRHKIIATDIDETILDRAKEGIFTLAELKNIPNNYIAKYFNKVNDKYVISNEIKRYVAFKKHDLILDSYEKNFDSIICRNVVIYFNNDIKNQMYSKFSESLKPGGTLFVGATESIYNYRDYGFEKASTFIYKKI